jgi:hypothetical protein
VSLLVIPFNANWLDKLPEDIKTSAIAYANFSKEKGIFPLLESNLTDFETLFVQAGRYFYNYMVQISSIIISRYKNQGDDIISNMNQSFFEGLNEARKEFSKFGEQPIVLLMADSIDVIENFIKLSSLSTFSLDPQYYTMAFEAFINVSVCLSVFWLVKTDGKDLRPEINNLLIQKFEDNIEILNELVNKIQIEEDKKAVMEGRHEYTEGKTQKFDNMDAVLHALESS